MGLPRGSNGKRFSSKPASIAFYLLQIVSRHGRTGPWRGGTGIPGRIRRDFENKGGLAGEVRREILPTQPADGGLNLIVYYSRGGYGFPVWLAKNNLVL